MKAGGEESDRCSLCFKRWQSMGMTEAGKKKSRLNFKYSWFDYKPFFKFNLQLNCVFDYKIVVNISLEI